MPFNLKNRHFLTIHDFTPKEVLYLLDLARDLKRAKYAGVETQRLRGKNVALIFEKDSTRTRCAFEVACYDQGANVTYLGPSGSQIGKKETMKDTARVLGRMYDAIEYRGYGQAIVEELAKWAGVPVYNGLTDEFHPTQILADLLTMREHSDKPLSQVSYAYLGDARNNMGNTLMLAGALMGMDVRLGAPKHLWPVDELVAKANELAAASGGKVTLTEDPKAAVRGVDFVHTDVWVSMGEPDSVWAERIKLLLPYQVNAALMAATGNPKAKFLHCLPSFHNRDTKIGEDIFKKFGIDAMEVDRRRLRVAGVRRLRPGREPPPHDQGRPRRDARRLGAAEMRVVVALGGNALLKRGEPMTAENQRANVKRACEALAPVANDNEIVISHGNGPQVGLIALQQSAYAGVEPYPLDVLGAQTEGMIGYVIEQEMGNLLPFERPFATILSMTEVDPADPAFRNPTKPIGPVYGEGRRRPDGGREGLDLQGRRRRLPPRRPVAAAEADLRDPPGEVAPREGDGRHLRGRRRHPDDVRARPEALRNRSRHRQGPRLARSWRARSRPTRSSWRPTPTPSTSAGGPPRRAR